MNDKPEDDIDTPNPFRKSNICIYCDVFVDYIALGVCVPKTKAPRDKAPLLSAKLIANNCDLLYLNRHMFSPTSARPCHIIMFYLFVSVAFAWRVYDSHCIWQ